MSDPLERLLSEGMADMGLAYAPQTPGLLLELLGLLRKWNRVYNLTSIKTPEQMVRLHLLDSLSLLPYLSGERVLDVGTGAGFPGLPLAILARQKKFTLLDSNAKKTRFVQQAAIELGLDNVRVHHGRIEAFLPPHGYDCILVRAFAGLPAIVGETARLLNPGGVILAQKGKKPDREIGELENVDARVFPLTIPGIEAERHLIVMKFQG